MQRKLQAWYKGFRLNYQSDVRQRIRQLFEKNKELVEADLQRMRARLAEIPFEWSSLLVTHIFATEGHRISVSDLSSLIATELRGRSMNEAAPAFGVSADGRTVHRPRAKLAAETGAVAKPETPSAIQQESKNVSGSSSGESSQPSDQSSRVEALERVVRSLLMEMVILQERVEALELRCNAMERKV